MASNYYYDVFKLTKEIRDSFKVSEDMESVYEMTKSLKSMYEPYAATMKLCKSEMNFAEETRKIQKMFEDANLTKLLGVSEQLKTSSFADISEMSKSLKQFANAGFLQGFKNFATISEAYDFQKLTRIMQDSLGQIDWSQDVSIDEITEDIAEHYIEEENEITNSLPDSRVKPLDVGKVKSEMSFWITIIGFLLTIYGLISSKPPVEYNTYNNTVKVNNNFTVEMGFDAEFMNKVGYRIINQNDVMPRVKPDCSSRVTGHLYIGQVVNISDKHKKWIEITWKNDDGDYCSGWIQNYKVTKFK